MSKYCYECGYINNDAEPECANCGCELDLSGESHSRGINTNENYAAQTTLLNTRYKIIKLIKSGAMGCVYNGFDLDTGKDVALKKLYTHQSGMDLDEAVEAFRREAKILSGLKHRGIPSVYDFFTDSDPETGLPACWMVMTYVDGEDLESYLKKQTLPLSDIWVKNLLLRLLDILQYLHSQKPPIIYRDIKPSNIMLSTSEVYLVDFGIARVMNRNQKGTQIGTPGYAPPEQYKGYADERSDIYALGVLIHYLLTGKNPEDSQTPFSFKSIYNVNPNVDYELSKLVDSMIELLPEKRPENVGVIYEYVKRKVAYDPTFPAMKSEYARITQNGSIKYGSWMAGIIGGLYLLSLGSCIMLIGNEKNMPTPSPSEYRMVDHSYEIARKKEEAEIYYQEKKYQHAVEKYTELINSYSTDYQCYINRGKSYMKLGYADKAFEDFETAAEKKPDSSEACFYMALIKKDKNPYYALEKLNEAININQDFKEARILRAEIYKKRGEYNEADADYLEIYRNENDKSKYPSKLAETAFLRKDYQKALKLINKAIEISPSVSSYHILKAKILKAAGRKENP